ncbi:MAG: hypothetical protein EBX40_04275 [Gammaproteobacteria bacterium]|nr:hypothetical protein [Gammaproteobacteria bacterium]
MIKRTLKYAFFVLSFASVTAFAGRPVEITLVNASKVPVCVYGLNGKNCVTQGSTLVHLNSQTFYERDGVVRVSINNQPARIGMFKRNIQAASVYVDENQILQTESDSFEKGSFVVSDDLDYLYFIAQPNALFTRYPY